MGKTNSNKCVGSGFIQIWSSNATVEREGINGKMWTGNQGK